MRVIDEAINKSTYFFHTFVLFSAGIERVASEVAEFSMAFLRMSRSFL